MALAKYQLHVVNEHGRVVAGATVTVRREVAGLPAAPLFSDREGITGIGSSVTSDASGYAAFFVRGGFYRITATKDTFSREWSDVGIGTAQGYDVADADFAVLGVAGAEYLWDPGTADANPGTGYIRANNATLASATRLYISETDRNASPAAAVIASWDESTSAIKGELTIKNAVDPAIYAQFNITAANSDAGSYDRLTVAYVGGAGSFALDDRVAVIFSRVGDKGDPGAPNQYFVSTTEPLGANVGDRWFDPEDDVEYLLYDDGDSTQWIETGPGADGDIGASVGLRQTYSSTTGDADPGNGKFRLNHATPASATAGYFDNLDAGGTTVSGIIDTWDDSTNTVRGRLRIQHLTDTAMWAEWNVTGSVTDGTGYRKVILASGAGSGAFTDGDPFVIVLIPAGNVGASGAGGTGGPGATGASGSSDWVLLATVTASNQGSVDFTSGITSTYNSYEVVFSHVIPITDAVSLYFLTSTDAGSSYDAGASDYSWVRRVTALNVGATQSITGDDADAQIVLVAAVGNNTGETVSGKLRFFRPSAALPLYAVWEIVYRADDGIEYLLTAGGSRVASADVDAIRFIMNSGNISSGVFKLYGLKA